jgi:hypothetical protein
MYVPTHIVIQSFIVTLFVPSFEFVNRVNCLLQPVYCFALFPHHLKPRIPNRPGVPDVNTSSIVHLLSRSVVAIAVTFIKEV